MPDKSTFDSTLSTLILYIPWGDTSHNCAIKLTIQQPTVRRSTRCLGAFAASEGQDQPAHPRWGFCGFCFLQIIGHTRNAVMRMESCVGWSFFTGRTYPWAHFLTVRFMHPICEFVTRVDYLSLRIHDLKFLESFCVSYTTHADPDWTLRLRASEKSKCRFSCSNTLIQSCITKITLADEQTFTACIILQINIAIAINMKHFQKEDKRRRIEDTSCNMEGAVADNVGQEILDSRMQQFMKSSVSVRFTMWSWMPLLTHCCQETLKGVHRQTVKTQIRRRLMIRVSTVCWQQFFSGT